MILQPQLIEAVAHQDNRGQLFAFPELDLSEVVRMYAILPENTSIIRAWQGHRLERKWFYAAAGGFEVRLIPLDENAQPVPAKQMKYELSTAKPQHLLIPGGYLNGFRAMEPQSALMVLSDFSLEASKADDLRVGLDAIPWNEIAYE